MPDSYETQQERDLLDADIQLCVDPNCKRIFRHKAHGKVVGGRPAAERHKA